MADQFFAGSDEVRSSGGLDHAQYLTLETPLDLESGGRLDRVTVAYETWGTLNDAGDNAVLLCHALTGDSHAARHDDNDVPGWWDLMVGPGKPIDTDRLFVICPNSLGGCSGTTGPNSINSQTGKPYGRDFPDITIGDIVEVQKRLVEQLGIERLLAVIGGSMGGHMVLCWATHHAERVRGAVALATSPRLTSQSLSFDIVGRNAIRHDPQYQEGQYYDQPDGPVTGLAIARMLGHITYLSPQSMSEKFEATRNKPRNIDTDFETSFSVASYLAYKGEKFTERFDANSYLSLTMAMDRFDLGATQDELRRAFADSQVRWLVVSFKSDWLFPPRQSRDMVAALVREGKPVSYCNVTSNCGHDAFLLSDDIDQYGELVRGFLVNLLGQRMEVKDRRTGHSPTSIFHHHRRLDYERIVDLVDAGESVLDLGCGRGGLLDRLAEAGHTKLQGLEINEQCVLSCVQRGLDVVHENLEFGLDWFADKQYDVVLLSRTIQAILAVESVIDAIVRVGRRAVVSVPNFAYYKLQDMMAETGRTPEAALLRYKWYNTPNIRVLTLRDFEDFCEQKNLRVHRAIYLDTEGDREVSRDDNPNRNADLAIYVISD